MGMKYRDSSLPLETRLENLMENMTLKEKAGQLNQRMFGWKAYRKDGENFSVTKEFQEEIAAGDGVGALYGLFRADPWSKVDFSNGIPARDSAKVTNMLQKYVLENTRLGIPLLFSEECPHGHMALDAAILPTNLGIGSTWNPGLYGEAFACVAGEIRSRGCHMGLVSALDILRDPRWGRCEECFGEDPYLSSRMAEAVTVGLQGSEPEDLKRSDKVVAVLKHFAAQGSSQGGRNGKAALIGERELREIHLPAMKAGVEAGAKGCMAAYNEIDGIFCHANKKLLTDILRNEWHFDGVVMSDGCAVDNLIKMMGGEEEAVAAAVEAGVDMNLWSHAYLSLESAVRSHKVSEQAVDDAVRRVLRLKFELGLFDQPYTDETRASFCIGAKQTEELNLQLARESAVLLKNQNSLLPLDKKVGTLAVIGPNADSLYSQLGDYTPPQRRENGVTVLDGIRAAVSEETRVLYAKGCGIRNPSKDGFAEAVAAAEQADAVVLVLGGSSARDFSVSFENNGAAKLGGEPLEMDCGEGMDVADVTLGGVQTELAKAIAATGKPVAAVLIQGRPYAIPWVAENCGAVLCAWYPGTQGGRAIADILFGDVNPSGKLPVSLPRSSAQIPVSYNDKQTSPYVDMPSSPLFPFGYGLSYTEFAYGPIRQEKKEIRTGELENGGAVEVSVPVTNTGSRRGAEVVQLYLSALHSRISRRCRELKGFVKLELAPGETGTAVFRFGKEELGVWNEQMKFTVEPGDVRITVGCDPEKAPETVLTVL